MNVICVKFTAESYPNAESIIRECGGTPFKQGAPELHMYYAIADSKEAIHALAITLNAREDIIRVTTPTVTDFRANYLSSSANLHHDLCYQYKRTNLFRAWKITRGNPAVKFAVVDSGLLGYMFPPGTGDMILPDYSYKTYTDENVPWDDYSESHGTTVWSPLKGNYINGKGISGACPDCYGIFIAISVPGFNSFYDPAGAIIRAFNQGARVINMSWGVWVDEDENGNPLPTTDGGAALSDGLDIKEAMEYVMSQGCILVVAAGNYNEYRTYNPRRTPLETTRVDVSFEVEGSILVIGGAGGPDPHEYDTPWNGDNGVGATWIAPSWGAGIDFTVPASDAFHSAQLPDGGSPYAGSGPNFMFGYNYNNPYIYNGSSINNDGLPKLTNLHATSFAAPLAAGIVSLVLSVNPSLTYEQVKEILFQTGTIGRHPDYVYRYPRARVIDAGRAVTRALTTLPENAGNVYPYLSVYPCTAMHYDGNGNGHINLAEATELFLTGESSDPISSVELWVGGNKVYDGPPTHLAINASYDGVTRLEVKVVANTDTTTTEEVYDDIYITSLESIQPITVEQPTIPSNARCPLEPWSIPTKRNALINTLQESESVLIKGIGKLGIMLEVLTPGFSINKSTNNGTSWWGYTTSTRVYNGDLIKVRCTAAASPQGAGSTSTVSLRTVQHLLPIYGEWTLEAEELPKSIDFYGNVEIDSFDAGTATLAYSTTRYGIETTQIPQSQGVSATASCLAASQQTQQPQVALISADSISFEPPTIRFSQQPEFLNGVVFYGTEGILLENVISIAQRQLTQLQGGTAGISIQSSIASTQTPQRQIITSFLPIIVSVVFRLATKARVFTQSSPQRIFKL